MSESDEPGAILLLDAETERLLSSIPETFNKSLSQLIRTALWYFNCLFGMLVIVSLFGVRQHDYTVCTAPISVNVDNLSSDCMHPPMHYDAFACVSVALGIAGILVSMIVGRIALSRLRITLPAD